VLTLQFSCIRNIQFSQDFTVFNKLPVKNRTVPTVRIVVFTVETGLFQVRKNSVSSRIGDLLITKNKNPLPDASKPEKPVKKHSS